MKKNLLIAGAALTMIACSQSPSTEYTVEWNATSSNNNKMAYIVDFDNRELRLDSTVVEEGKAVFNGSTDDARMVQIYIDGKRKAMFILEPGNITIDSLGTAAGSALNVEFENFNAASDSIRRKFMEVARDTANREESEQLQQAYMNLEKETAAKNQGNPIGYYLFLQKAYSFQPTELDSAIAADSTLLQYTRVQKLVEGVQRKLATSEGNMFTDFEIAYDGKNQKLSEYVGKGQYAIVDFWASWCGPCMREAETLKKIYKKWGGKGLEIVGVAVWDEPANSLKAIDEKGLSWKHIINGQSIPTDLYGINGIPCIVIVDPDGQIIGRDIRGEELEKFIDEKLTDKK